MQFHWDAFHNGFREIFGVEASVSEAKHHGATDQLIAEAVLTGRGVSKEEVWAKMDAFLDCMREYAQKHRSVPIRFGNSSLLPSSSAERDLPAAGMRVEQGWTFCQASRRLLLSSVNGITQLAWLLATLR